MEWNFPERNLGNSKVQVCNSVKVCSLHLHFGDLCGLRRSFQFATVPILDYISVPTTGGSSLMRKYRARDFALGYVLGSHGSSFPTVPTERCISVVMLMDSNLMKSGMKVDSNLMKKPMMTWTAMELMLGEFD